MTIFGKMIGLFVIMSLISLTSTKNYQFQVTYQCQNNQFLWYEQRLMNETLYQCKNWVHKILITQPKAKYVRFQSEMSEQQQKIQQDEEKDFEQEEKKQQLQEQLKKEEEQEEILQEIEEIQEEEQKEKEKDMNMNEATISADKSSKSQQQTNKESTRKAQANKKSQQNKKQLHDRYFDALNIKQNSNDRRLISLQQQENDLLTHKLASIFHKANPNLPKNHKLKSLYGFEESQKEIKHFFQLRHNQEEKEEKQKFKPIKIHRRHSIEDVMFLLELIEMNSFILQSTLPLNSEDVPTYEQLRKKHPKPVLQQGTNVKQGEKHESQIKNKHESTTVSLQTQRHLRTFKQQSITN